MIASFRRARRARGFTLLEVMMAMAILAVSLSALVGHQSVAIQMSDYSNKASQATYLAEGKLLDVEDQMLRDSMDVLDNCDQGDFRREGLKRFKWKACGYKLEIQDGTAEALTEKFMALLGGLGGGLPGGLGDAAGGIAANPNVQGQLALAVGLLPTIIGQLEDKIRKVRVEVNWTDQTGDHVITLERFVTSLGMPASGTPPPADGEVVAPLEQPQ
ncbi:MAG: prepilin-type N-terminal cleavage/methylation domain-containing protein [Bradymonadia bacterium]